MERILKSVDVEKLECLKTFRLVFESVSDIIFSQKLKKDQKQSWLEVCETKSSWLVQLFYHFCKRFVRNCLFEELLNILQMTLKLDKIIKAHKLK